MKRWATHNAALKLGSIAVAVLLWLVVVNIDNPIIRKDFTNVQVELTHEDAITDKEKVCSVEGNSDIITVTVRGPRSIVDSLNASDFKASADLRELTDFEFVPIEITALRYKDKLSSVESKTKNVKVNIEELSSKQFAIKPSIIGTPAAGYAVGDTSLSQNVVKINGPASVMSTISRVVAEVNVSDMSTDINTPVSITLYDGNDRVVDTTSLKMSVDSVNVTVQMLPTKEVVVTADTTGTPADGCRVVGDVAIAPETVVIAAKESVLSKINEIKIDKSEIDVTGKSESFEQMIDISKYVQDGVTICSDTEVLATINIEQLESKDVYYPVNGVQVSGLDEKYKYVYTNFDPIQMNIWGQKEKVDSINIGAIVSVKADLSSITDVGNYTVPVTVELKDGYFVFDEFTINIHVYEGNLDYSQIGISQENTKNDR